MPGHPHAGGEIGYWGDSWKDSRGPSPRGWGNQGLRIMLTAGLRAIPTRVGKSTNGPSPVRTHAGHPHAGGEISPKADAHSAENGPSPRGWGNPGLCRGWLVEPRAIPTRVGKSSPAAGRRSRTAGHPHAGGEIVPRKLSPAPLYGPSPRGWGNLGGGLFRVPKSRAIPTRVGKSRALPDQHR